MHRSSPWKPVRFETTFAREIHSSSIRTLWICAVSLLPPCNPLGLHTNLSMGHSHYQQTVNHANWRLKRSLLVRRTQSTGLQAYQHQITDLPMVMENLCLDLRLRRRLHDFVAVAVFGKSIPMKICHPMFGTGHFQTMITYCTLPVDRCHTVSSFVGFIWLYLIYVALARLAFAYLALSYLFDFKRLI